MLIILGLIAAFIIMLIVARPGTRACRWRADRRRDDASGHYYRCAACGAEARTPGRPPRACFRGRDA